VRAAQLGGGEAENPAMESLVLYRGALRLACIPVGDRPVEIGRARGCDLVVDDPEVADRHWLAMPREGTLVLCDVSRGARGRAGTRRLPFGTRTPLGREHAVERVAERGTPVERDTVALPQAHFDHGAWTVVVGRGHEARRVGLGDAPLHVGRDPDNDLVLADPAVSAHHCRLERHRHGVLVRDLGSLNGTFVHGARVELACVGSGARLRVGQTDVTLSERSTEAQTGGSGMIAESPAMLDVLAEVQRLARLPWPVLLLGESGTGKEGLARALHDNGPRHGKPFVALNAGGLARDLVESELFGHERGAFTGANASHRGVFEQADGGTLFLDEVGELPLELQARLLRVLEVGELRRVGGEHRVRVDVRLVCATHRDLRAMAAAGEFRQDLYFRIARLVVEVPALRFRPDDVRALAAHFLRQMADDVGTRELSPEALARLAAYPWPGNARELRNILSAALAASAGTRIEAVDVDRALARFGAAGAGAGPSRDALQQTVDHCGGNLAAAARVLGLPRSTLRDRLRAA
jgi:transcriptional regulator with AAA-type ATPase domain